MLVHARGASKGVGEPSINKNNHPFTTCDKTLALVHNGRVDDCEYRTLKQKYETNSDCDSEILLRIIAAEGDNRLQGIKQVWSLINEGHMAVGLGERIAAGQRNLWLFRNQHRPIWLVDLREKLGQIFFFSEPSIWEDAVTECSLLRNFTSGQKLIEIPHHQIWSFKLQGSQVQNCDIERYEVQKKETKLWEYDGVYHALTKNDPICKVISELSDNDQIAKKPKAEISLPNEELRLDLVNSKCDEIIDVVNNIRQYSEQLANEQSISKNDFDNLLSDLENMRQELVNISIIVNR